MTALTRHAIVLAVLLVGCKGKAPAPAATPGSAATSSSAAMAGSAVAEGSATPGLRDDKKMVRVKGMSMLDFTAHFTDEDSTFFMRGRSAIKNGFLYQTIAMGVGTTPSASAQTFIETVAVK